MSNPTTPHNDSKQSVHRTDTQMQEMQMVYNGSIPVELTELSKDALRRIRALKKLQLDEFDILSQYYQRVREIGAEFEKEYEAIRGKRAAIVTGQREPTDEECQLPVVHHAKPADLEALENNAPTEKVEGIPDFWMTALQNAKNVYEFLPQDVEALKYLRDITCEMRVGVDPHGYTISFHFAPNPFFTDTVLKKHYTMDMKPDPEMPFDYDGPIIHSSVGEKINWKEGKDLTKMQGRQKRDMFGKLIPNEHYLSFFSYFDTDTKKLGTLAQPISESLEDAIIDDFEMGEALRQHVIPRAVLFITDEVDEECEKESEWDSDEEMSIGEAEGEVPPPTNGPSAQGDDAKMVA